MGRNGGESAGSGMREGELVGSGGDGWELEDSGEAQQWSAAMRGDSTASPVVGGDGEDNGPSRFPDTDGDPIFHTPPHAPTGAEGVGHFRVSPEGKSFAEMAGQFHQMFSFFRAGSDFVHSRVQCSGEVFPLPENLTVLSSQVGHLSAERVVVLQALCSALNSYYGVARGKIWSLLYRRVSLAYHFVRSVIWELWILLQDSKAICCQKMPGLHKATAGDGR